MKLIILFFSLLIISCGSKEKTSRKDDYTGTSEKTISQNNTLINSKLSFEKTQDSLRKTLLNSKPNENLKSSILQELYIRGLVNQVDDKIKFNLPFNLHGLDCGTPDCYSTDILFEITAKNPIIFPEIINFKLLEHGCDIEQEITESGVFKLVEQSSKYVNYYSENQKSNLIILNEKKALYYFTDVKPNIIKINLLDKIFDEYSELNLNALTPYQSTIMTTNEYENFIEGE